MGRHVVSVVGAGDVELFRIEEWTPGKGKDALSHADAQRIVGNTRKKAARAVRATDLEAPANDTERTSGTFGRGNHPDNTQDDNLGEPFPGFEDLAVTPPNPVTPPKPNQPIRPATRLSTDTPALVSHAAIRDTDIQINRLRDRALTLEAILPHLEQQADGRISGRNLVDRIAGLASYGLVHQWMELFILADLALKKRANEGALIMNSYAGRSLPLDRETLYNQARHRELGNLPRTFLEARKEAIFAEARAIDAPYFQQERKNKDLASTGFPYAAATRIADPRTTQRHQALMAEVQAINNVLDNLKRYDSETVINALKAAHARTTINSSRAEIQRLETRVAVAASTTSKSKLNTLTRIDCQHLNLEDVDLDSTERASLKKVINFVNTHQGVSRQIMFDLLLFKTRDTPERDTFLKLFILLQPLDVASASAEPVSPKALVERHNSDLDRIAAIVAQYILDAPHQEFISHEIGFCLLPRYATKDYTAVLRVELCRRIANLKNTFKKDWPSTKGYLQDLSTTMLAEVERDPLNKGAICKRTVDQLDERQKQIFHCLLGQQVRKINTLHPEKHMQRYVKQVQAEIAQAPIEEQPTLLENARTSINPDRRAEFDSYTLPAKPPHRYPAFTAPPSIAEEIFQTIARKATAVKEFFTIKNFGNVARLAVSTLAIVGSAPTIIRKVTPTLSTMASAAAGVVYRNTHLDVDVGTLRTSEPSGNSSDIARFSQRPATRIVSYSPDTGTRQEFTFPGKDHAENVLNTTIPVTGTDSQYFPRTITAEQPSNLHGILFGYMNSAAFRAAHPKYLAGALDQSRILSQSGNHGLTTLQHAIRIGDKLTLAVNRTGNIIISSWQRGTLEMLRGAPLVLSLAPIQQAGSFALAEKAPQNSMVAVSAVRGTDDTLPKQTTAHLSRTKQAAMEQTASTTPAASRQGRYTAITTRQAFYATLVNKVRSFWTSLRV